MRAGLLSCVHIIACRDMVVAAFRSRPEWEVRVVERAEEEPAEGTSSSHLHWGEYEGIDWERVHRGVALLLSSIPGPLNCRKRNPSFQYRAQYDLHLSFAVLPTRD